jgi:hypothetical protein
VKILMMQATGSGSSMYEMKSMDGAPRSKWSTGRAIPPSPPGYGISSVD